VKFGVWYQIYECTPAASGYYICYVQTGGSFYDLMLTYWDRDQHQWREYEAIPEDQTSNITVLVWFDTDAFTFEPGSDQTRPMNAAEQAAHDRLVEAYNQYRMVCALSKN